MLKKCLQSGRALCLLLLPLVPAVLAGHARAELPVDGIALVHADRPESMAPSRPLSGPLNEHDAALYHRIFALQEVGDWEAADALIERLRNPILMGHVLFQRYMHPTAYRSSYAELSAWLEEYADHPGADDVHRLAKRRRPAGAGPLTAPLRGYLGGSGQELQEMPWVRYNSRKRRSGAEEATVRAWRRKLETFATRGRADAALGQFNRKDVRPLLDRVEIDIARWHVAEAHRVARRDRAALSHAAAAAKRSGETVPEMHWTAGIAAWRLGRTSTAARHFAALAEADDAYPAERSRAAFWAARAAIALRRPQHVRHFLAIAAGQRDFYGLLARAALGRQLDYDWQDGDLEYAALRLLMRYPAAKRAMALGQIRRLDLAEQEIRKLAARASPELTSGLMALAGSLHLPAAQMRLAQRLDAGDNHGALYPLPSWRPGSGFKLDRALLFAVIRAESAFDPNAKSHVGALGLMQVMPATARMVAKIAALDLPHGEALREPETSLSFGQAYLEHLLNWDAIGDNLMYVAAAYNAGPGRVLKWRGSLTKEDDPLLFLESIPFKETRVYVKKVLANFWVYRARLGQAQPSLAALVRGDWPSYQPMDPRQVVHAQN